MVYIYLGWGGEIYKEKSFLFILPVHFCMVDGVHTVNCAVCDFCITLLISYSFFSICVHKTKILGFIIELICQKCNASLAKLPLQASCWDKIKLTFLHNEEKVHDFWILF